MCTCNKCKEQRLRKKELDTITRQMSNAANELDILNAMLVNWPDKQKQLRGAADMLANWEIDIVKDFDI